MSGKTIIESAYSIIEIDRNLPNAPMDGSGDVFISMCPKEEEGVRARGVCGAIPADALRAAIDEAVGPRQDSRPPSDWERELLTGRMPKGERACLDRQRDRHLRHISDLEGILTRRNERHEKDQETIREKEEQIKALKEHVVELRGHIARLQRSAASVAASCGTPQPEVEKAVVLDYLGTANNSLRYVLSVPVATGPIEHAGPYTMTLGER